MSVSVSDSQSMESVSNSDSTANSDSISTSASGYASESISGRISTSIFESRSISVSTSNSDHWIQSESQSVSEVSSQVASESNSISIANSNAAFTSGNTSNSVQAHHQPENSRSELAPHNNQVPNLDVNEAKTKVSANNISVKHQITRATSYRLLPETAITKISELLAIISTLGALIIAIGTTKKNRRK